MRELVAAAGLLFVLVPRVLMAQPGAGTQATQTADDSRPRRLSVNFAAGVTIPSGSDSAGNVLSVALGYSPTPKVTFLVSGVRAHRPTNIQQFTGGDVSTTRGGTLQFVGGEVRFTLRPGQRVSPYVMTGAGVGVWHGNVDDTFPTASSEKTRVLFAGGGVLVPLGPHLRVSGDVGFVFLVGERDAIALFLPLRAGLAWRF